MPGSYSRPVLRPRAPASISRSSSAAMLSISSAEASRLKSSPMTSRRIVPWPAKEARLIAAGFSSRRVKSFSSGNCELPSCPATAVVIPWLTAASAAR